MLSPYMFLFGGKQGRRRAAPVPLSAGAADREFPPHRVIGSLSYDIMMDRGTGNLPGEPTETRTLCPSP